MPRFPWDMIAWGRVYNLARMFLLELVKIALYRVLDGWNLHGGSSLFERLQPPLHPHGNLPRQSFPPGTSFCCRPKKATRGTIRGSFSGSSSADSQTDEA